MWEREKSTWPNHRLSRFVEAAGIRWHVQQTGRGPNMLLVHGTGASTHSWRDIIPLLAQSFTVLAADLPGHAFTDAVPPERRSINGMAEAMAGLLVALQFKPDYCVGHSAGAVVVCRMALAHCISPRAIISINGAFMPLSGAAGLLFSPIAKLLASSSVLPRILARRAANPANVARVLAGTGSRIDAAGLDLYTRLVSDPKHLAGALGMMSSWDLRAFECELPNLTTPLTLMVAENDRTVPPQQAQTVKRMVANAAIFSLPNLGHLAHEEQPALVAEQILRICHAAGGSA